jgi:hypothetical protein
MQKKKKKKIKITKLSQHHPKLFSQHERLMPSLNQFTCRSVTRFKQERERENDGKNKLINITPTQTSSKLL